MLKSITRGAGFAAAIVLCAQVLPAFARDVAYEKRVLVAGLPARGINGVVFGKDGLLYATSILGNGILRIDVTTGKIERIAPNQPSGDDLAFAPDGSIAWTALLHSEVRVRAPDGNVRTLATELPGVNPIIFGPDGMVYVGQVTQPDTLLVIDPSGRQPVRRIGGGYGGINAFELDGKGNLVVPLSLKGEIASIDIATGKVRTLVSGLGDVVALRTDRRGRYYAVEWTGGRVIELFPNTGKFRVIAQIAPPLDNLAVAADGTLYVSRPADTTLIAVDPKSGAQRNVVHGGFAAIGGVALTEHGGKPELLVADTFGYREVDLATGAVTAIRFDNFASSSSAIAVDGDNILFAQLSGGAVKLKRRTTGQMVHAWTSVAVPIAVALRDGRIFVLDYAAGELVELDPRAPFQKRIVVDGLHGPTGLVATANGGWIVSEAAAGQVISIAPSGGRRVLGRNLHQPEGLAMLPDGSIAVVEAGARRLVRLDPSSGKTSVIDADLPIGDADGIDPVPSHVPAGLAVSRQGIIYVTGDRDNSVLSFTPRN